MHKGRVEEANALAVKIRKEIIEFNCMTFTGANSKGGAKDLWDKVNEVLGKKKSAAQDSSLSIFTSQQLNEHYANLSFDNSYESIDCKSTVYPVSLSSLTEFDVYNMLDHLKPTSLGLDGLPSWFLRVLAPVICSPLTHIFNLSLSLSTYPSQWKQAVITPLPKVPTPNSCSDFRPISITSILSRTFEKLIINSFVYPLFAVSSVKQLFLDQFAFRPTGSTDAALICLLHHISTSLQNQPYVRVIALDFSKAFDTVRHSTTLTNLASLPLSDQIYNWFVNFFQDHSHCTRFLGSLSSSRTINASVFQGSVVGPPIYMIASMNLKPLYSGNYLDKYADDTYLLIRLVIAAL